MSVASEAPARAATPGDGAVSTGQRSYARWIVAAIVLVLAAGIILRFLTFSELWLDEALSVNISRLPLRDIPDWLRHDGAPPLYYFLLHVWTGVFGTSDFAVRSLSGIISVATIPPMWFAGRRIAGRAGAWIAVLLTAVSPFAIQFATETRMYSIQMLLVTLGYLALCRLLERPSLGRQAVVALISGLLLYSQYWSLYLLAVVGVVLVVRAWRGRSSEARHAARAGVVALIAGGITFLPWIPTFLYQSAHTGTPWGDPVLPTAVFAFTVRDFSGGEHSEAYVLLFLFLALTVVALFGKAIDRYRIELDVRTHPGVRVEAGVWIAALLLGGAAGLLARATFASRYASVVWPLFILVVVYGITVFTSFRVRAVIVAIVVAIGLVGGVRNVVGDKTQAKEVADAIKAHAQPGDVVLYCPDQLGPSTSRLLDSRRALKQLTFPFGDAPELVDWVDYKQRRDKVDANAFARTVSEKAAPGRTIWYVIATQYRGGNEGKCDAVQRALTEIRGTNPRLLVEPDDKFSEFLGLLEYPGR